MLNSGFYNMDCMEGMKQFPDKFFDLAIVDPPYGIKRFEKSFGTTRFKTDSRVAKNGIAWDKKPDIDYFKELFRVSENQIVWGGNNFELPNSEYFLIWDKKQTVDNFASAEYAWVSEGLKMPAKIFEYSIHKHNQTEKIHPTQKPIELYKWLLSKYAKQGDKILDTHVGSASSLIACLDMGFEYWGFELDKDYYEAASKRIDEFQRQYKLFEAV